MKFLNIIFALTLVSSFSLQSAEETFVGDVSMGEVTHSSAFNYIKNNMLGKWKGELTQESGNVISASYHFKLVSNGNTIREELVEDGVEMFTTYSDKDYEYILNDCKPKICIVSNDIQFKKIKKYLTSETKVFLIDSLNDEFESIQNILKKNSKQKKLIILKYIINKLVERILLA